MCGERVVHFHTPCIVAFRYTSRSERGLPSAGKHTKGCCGQEPAPHNILGKRGTRLKRGYPDRFWEGAFSEGPSWNVVVLFPQHGGKTAPLYGNNAAFFSKFSIGWLYGWDIIGYCFGIFQKAVP